jgi:tetratricopeptide (TPR) repeat protein
MKHRHFNGGLLASGLIIVAVAGCGTSAERRKIQQASHSARAALVAKHAAPSLAQLDAACREPSCGCVTGATRALLDGDIGKEALTLLQAAPTLCGQPPAGMRAEALVHAEDAGAKAAAQAAVAADPQDPFAHQALALLAYRDGRQPEAMKEASLARGAGRGGAALLLQGLVSFTDGDLIAAERAFAELVKLSPADLIARYDLALVAQKLGRFHDSREGYLSVLADDPKNLDARFNLGVLTWQAGATDEARHHLDKLREVAPKGSDLVPRLEAMLKTTPPSNAQINPAQPAGGSAAKPMVVTKTVGAPRQAGPGTPSVPAPSGSVGGTPPAR